MSEMTDIAAQGSAAVLVLGLAVAVIRKHMAQSKSAEAEANHAATNTKNTDKLFEHFRQELAASQERERRMVDSVNQLLRELALQKELHAKIEAELNLAHISWKASVASEKRFRAAFSALHVEFTKLMHISRPNLPSRYASEMENRVNQIMIDLNTPERDEKDEIHQTEQGASVAGRAGSSRPDC